MTRALAIGGVVLMLALITAALVPMWMMSAHISMSIHGYIAVILMIIFSFAVGGGLMFLVFYSARHGIDDEVGRLSHDDDHY